MNKPDVYLIDASIFVFRSYYANGNEFQAKNGDSINAVYGFARFLIQFIHQTKAQYIACAFDESLETSYRNEIYPAYKANRQPAPADLKHQFKLCQRVAQVLGVATFCDGYYEADDLIGTLAKHYSSLGHSNHIISADKDLAQLVGATDTWWNYGKDNALNSQMIFEKFGVYPNQIADLLAITGDSVDNIPGIPGVGSKSAIFLLNHFKTLEQVLKRHKEIAYLSFRGAKSCQIKIAKHIEDANMAKKLTEIVTDIALDDFDIHRKILDETRVYKLFDYLNFGPILRKNILDLRKT
ncbi:DNA polymerase I [hydrothermal vent metagenome]|uniref:DNA polymerase I n=1 Tax=hydrothermal vent metagenome TaxID=652676 RepID=A0A3B0USA6_9ZZZZ